MKRLLTGLILEDAVKFDEDQPRDESGKWTEGGGGGGEGSGKVGTTPDHTGKIPVPAQIAREGYDMAANLIRADQVMSDAVDEKFRLQHGKPGRGAKARTEHASALARAEAQDEKTTKEYHEQRTKVEAWQKANGISAVDAWQAHTGRYWPHYRVDTSDRKITHYVPKK